MGSEKNPYVMLLSTLTHQKAKTARTAATAKLRAARLLANEEPP